MSLPALDNLIRIGQLKVEPRKMAEVKRMLKSRNPPSRNCAFWCPA